MGRNGLRRSTSRKRRWQSRSRDVHRSTYDGKETSCCANSERKRNRKRRLIRSGCCARTCSSEGAVEMKFTSTIIAFGFLFALVGYAAPPVVPAQPTNTYSPDSDVNQLQRSLEEQRKAYEAINNLNPLSQDYG